MDLLISNISYHINNVFFSKLIRKNLFKPLDRLNIRRIAKEILKMINKLLSYSITTMPVASFITYTVNSTQISFTLYDFVEICSVSVTFP